MRGDLASQQGFQKERKVTIDAQAWEALQRLVWRMKVSWAVVESEAQGLLDSCRHADGCRGLVDTDATCLQSCPDRELRKSSLVLRANAREFGRVSSRRPESPFFPPTREFFDLIVGDLAAAEAQLREIKTTSETRPELPEVPSIPPPEEPSK